VDVLRRLHEMAGVQVVFSVGTIDEAVWRQTEPGAPHPMARLEAMQYLVEHGVAAGVLAAPLLPGMSDTADSINALVQAAAEHRAQFLSGNLLFLRPGSREWFMPLIREAYPHLAPGYARLYRSDHAPRDYTNAVLGLVDDARLRWELPRMPSIKGLQPTTLPGFGGTLESPEVASVADEPPDYATQLALPLAA
jgi:DNA repair photolyase